MTDLTTPPSFTGLLLHRNPDRTYSFFVPDGWVRAELESSVGSGVIYAPPPADPLTSISVEARDLGVTVDAGDLPALRAGFLAGLRKFPHSKVESSEAEVVGDLITMEARHTFQDGVVTRKRWVRLLYQGATQIRMIAQGATVEQFEYWLPMFFEAMRTVRFGDWLAELGGTTDSL